MCGEDLHFMHALPLPAEALPLSQIACSIVKKPNSLFNFLFSLCYRNREGFLYYIAELLVGSARGEGWRTSSCAQEQTISSAEQSVQAKGESTMTNPLRQLEALGQSIWLDDIDRGNRAPASLGG